MDAVADAFETEVVDWLQEALLAERAAVAQELLSRHSAMATELEARLRAPAPGRRRPPSQWSPEAERGPAGFVHSREAGEAGKATARLTDLEPADCGPPGCVYSPVAGEAGVAGARLTDLERGDCGPPGCVHLREAGEAGEAMAGLEGRGSASSPPGQTLAWPDKAMAALASWRASGLDTVSKPQGKVSSGPKTAKQRLFQSRTLDIQAAGMLKRFVTSNTMEVISALIIVATTTNLAAEIQYHGFQIGLDLGYRWYSRTPQETWPFAETMFEVTDYICGVALTLELLVKVVALGSKAFRDGWNLVDLVVTVFWYTEVISEIVLPVDPAILRMFRLVRLFRMVKLAKKIQSFDALYLMTTAIRGSASSLGWSCCLLFLFQIVVAILVNLVLVNWYLEESDEPVEERLLVFEYWGSFSRAILTTFEITLADFPEPCRMLSEFVSEWFMVFFIAHKLTIGFAVIGVINGVFIQETFKVADTDDHLMIRQRQRMENTHALKMGKLFQAADDSGDGLVDLQEFQATMQEPDVQAWMASMDLDVEDAGIVFQLVDADGDGRLTADELVTGVSRLMGDARNLDMLVLMREQTEIMRLIEKEIIPQLGLVLGKPARRRTAASRLGQARLSRLSARGSSS